MKVEMSYVNSIKIGDVEEIITPSEKKFYRNKIIVKSNEEILTLLVSSMDKETLDIVDIIYQKEKAKEKSKKEEKKQKSQQKKLTKKEKTQPSV